jgi:two-component system, NarL family, nitrate/nitrite response regulator NarL
MSIRCLIVDDNEVFLDSARRLLASEGVEIVGTASTSAQALCLVSEAEPDVVLVDVELGDEDGFELARRLAALPPAMQVILISTYPEDDVAELVASSPAAGFIGKSSLSAEAVKALLA